MTGNVLINRANVVRYVGACAYVETTSPNLRDLCTTYCAAKFCSCGSGYRARCTVVHVRFSKQTSAARDSCAAASLLSCDKIFRARFYSDRQLLPRFLAELMKLRSVREHIESRLTGPSPTMKNISKPTLMDIRFPLPGSETQPQFVDGVVSLREDASAKRAEAAALRKSARTAFESALFTSSE